jgi:hypothetical protein
LPNVIAIIKEERVKRQVELLCSELGLNNLQIGHFKTSQDFERAYFKTPPDPELAVFEKVHLILFALDSIEGKVGPWIEKTRKSLIQYRMMDGNSPLRLIAMKYEDDNVTVQDVIHKKLDDLLFLPLDRLVFLQKMDIILHLPDLTRPRFLFTQDVNFKVEISKITKLDRLSDVGIGIRNPIPLKRGVPAHFYVQIPGEKEYLSLFGKVFRSEPHPDFPGQYIVYFNYHGLSRNDLTKVRRILAKSSQYKSLIDDDPENFRFQETNIFLSENQRRQLNVVILDPDEKVGQTLRGVLSKDIDRIKPVYENSYSMFLHKYFKPKVAAHIAPPRLVEPHELYMSPLKINVDSTTRKMLSVERIPDPTDTILGHNANELFSTPEGWLNLFPSKETQIVLDEAMFLARQGRKIRKVMIAQSALDDGCGLALSFAALPEDSQVSVTLEPSSMMDITEMMQSMDAPTSLDALVIDAAFVPNDTAAWVTWLKKRAVASKLISHQDALKIIVMTEKEADPPAKWLNVPEIVGVFCKPVDVRQFIFTLGEALSNNFTAYQFSNIIWAQPNLFIHAAKESFLESLSEFGVTLRTDRPITPGHFVYLRKSIYDNAPNGCLAARVYFSQPHPKEEGQFLTHATYFGINDYFLKFARTWIREHYATLKKQT